MSKLDDVELVIAARKHFKGYKLPVTTRRKLVDIVERCEREMKDIPQEDTEETGETIRGNAMMGERLVKTINGLREDLKERRQKESILEMAGQVIFGAAGHFRISSAIQINEFFWCFTRSVVGFFLIDFIVSTIKALFFQRIN